jgi:hypothetical protein
VTWNPLRSRLGKRITHRHAATYTTDAGGGRTPNYTVVAANLPCSIWPLASDPKLSEAFSRMDIVTTHALCFDQDLGVKVNDLLITGDGTVDGAGDKYLVAGAIKFEDPTVANVTVYLVAADLRIV